MQSRVELGGLSASLKMVSLLSVRFESPETYKIDFRLAIVLHRERERSLKSGVLVPDEEESLMWSFGLAIFCSCQNDLESVRCVQCHRFSQGSTIGEPGSISISRLPARSLAITYLSLNPPVPPFELTEITASSKLHEEAACANPAPKTSKDGSKERENRMVRDVACDVDFPELQAAYYV